MMETTDMQANPHSHLITDSGHVHGITGHEHSRVIADEDYLPLHLQHSNCRCVPAPDMKPEYTLTVKLDPATIDALMDEMRKTIAAAFGLKPSMLFGGEAPPAVSQEYRALLTVAAFPHTPE